MESGWSGVECSAVECSGVGVQWSSSGAAVQWSVGVEWSGVGVEWSAVQCSAVEWGSGAVECSAVGGSGVHWNRIRGEWSRGGVEWSAMGCTCCDVVKKQVVHEDDICFVDVGFEVSCTHVPAQQLASVTKRPCHC